MQRVRELLKPIQNRIHSVSENESKKDPRAIKGAWMVKLFPQGHVARPSRYPNAGEWRVVMCANQDWPFAVEDSSVVTCFMCSAIHGQLVLQAAEALVAIAESRGISSKDLSALYQGIRFYVASLSGVVADIVGHIKEAERRCGATFWIGAGENESRNNGLLRILGPVSEALWSMHIKLLLDMRENALGERDLSVEYAMEVFEKLLEAKSLLMVVVPLCVVDYCFHLRKNLTMGQVWRVVKHNMDIEHLKGFPRFRGMRLQILAGLVAAIPKEDRRARLRYTPPVRLPVSRWIFHTACDAIYDRSFVRPLRRLIAEAEALGMTSP